MNASGPSTFIKNNSDPATASENFSLFAFAKRLGIISATRNTTRVVTIVVRVT